MTSESAPSVSAALYGSKMGIAGIAILGVLVAISGIVISTGFTEHVQEWNDPTAWLSHPKSAVPIWANFDDLAEHLVVSPSHTETVGDGGLLRHTTYHTFEIRNTGMPSGTIYEYTSRYSGSALLGLEMFLGDGRQVEIARIALPFFAQQGEHKGRVFFTDAQIRSNIAIAFGDSQSVQEALFADSNGEAIAGTYTLAASIYDATGNDARIIDSVLVIGGGAYGAMGTDELRRDVAVGLLWGTPIALFVGIVVAVASVLMGLGYGMYAGYKGGRKDETMMRLNDVVYALPALPFLVILGVTISGSIFVTAAFLVVFGWVGVAKVSRSMALQAKARGYVEASKMMGQRDALTIIRHIMPQLLPYALASIAISVPAAITTEAGLSFLGLGDPQYPTWGSMLHDANNHGAAARGLWWWIVPPGMMIAITGLAFVFIGSAIDQAANPHQRRLV